MSKKLYHQFECSSMMLPEHRRDLDRHRERVRLKEERRPLLDEQQWELFQKTLETAVRKGLPLRVTMPGPNGRQFITGTAVVGEAPPGMLRLRTARGFVTVPANRVLALEIDPGAS